MKKTIKNVGLDVYKNSISIGIAEDRRDIEVLANAADTGVIDPMW